MTRVRSPVLGFAIAALTIFLDQLSKWGVIKLLPDAAQVIEIAPFFNLVHVWNRGVSFGLFGGAGRVGAWVMIRLAAVIVLGLLLWLRRVGSPVLALALGLVIGGAFGNVIDRLHFRAVFDFLDLHAAGYHWPAFNLADSAIVVGVAILVIDALFPSLFKKFESPYKVDG